MYDKDEQYVQALEYRALNNPCPLLKNGLCSVYERRPMSCRVYFALGNPKDCDLPMRKDQQFAIMPKELFEFLGAPATVNGSVVLEHLGILLAERLLGITLKSNARREAIIID